MREIKFRGLGIDGKWWYGETNPQGENHINLATFFANVHGGAIRPETVGGYIGLKAQDKRDLYKGDIIVFTNKEADHTPTAIIWNDYDLQFQTLGHGGLTDSEFTYQKAGQDCVAQNIKIIGDIYQNPKLVKVKV